MSKQILHSQLTGLSDLQAFLKGFQYRLNVLTDDYKIVLGKLESAGVPSEVLEAYFYLYRNANIQTLDSINEDITNLDIPYINRVINEINNAINASGR